MKLAFLLTIAVVDLFLAVLVLKNDSRRRVNRAFALLLLVAAGWAISDALMLFASDRTLVLLGLYGFMIFPLFVSLMILYFSYFFLREEDRRLNYGLLVSAAVPTLFYTSLLLINMDWFVDTGSIAIQDPQNILVPMQLYSLYSFYFTVYFVIYAGILFNKYRKSTGSERSQASHVLWALVLATIIAVITNLSLPSFLQDMTHVWVGPLSAAVFAVLVIRAVVWYQLFDIRLAVARSVAYALSILVLGIIYGIVAFGLLNRFIIGTTDISLQQQVVYTLLAVIVAFAFNPLKRFFDRWTNRLFYQDAYDPQEFLDELNQTLVGNIELRSMLSMSADVVQKHLKSEYCLFGLKETKTEKQRVMGATEKSFDYEDIELARRTTPQILHKVIVAGALEAPYTKLKKHMEKDNVAILVRLVDEVEMGKEGLGYLVLGNKRSGNPYNSQDVKVLEIIANELVIAIQNALRFEDIQNFNITLQEEVKRATKQLEEKNKRLILLDQTKDDFISMASHQLRTPLTSVKGYLSMTLEGDAGKVSEKQRKLLSQAFTSSQRMVYLIADMLNVSRLKTGKFVIEPEPTDLAEVVQTEIDQLQGTSAARGLKLTYKRPADFPTLMLDQTKIRQVIMNFADNAIYYTPSGGHIDVELKDTGKTIEFTVTDDGIGVPRREHHSLFSKFYRAGNAKKLRPDGTGLGLYMAKKVIIGHGGSVIFKSREGKGSTFGFALAKSKLAAHAAPPHQNP